MLRRLKMAFWPCIFIIYTRYLIGGAWVFAALIKLKGKRFTTSSGENEPFGTAFHFFETMYQSGLYWQFIGLAQLVTGLLLITQRYAKLGALINLPLVLNVFVITISLPGFSGTPAITGLMLLASLVLLWWHSDELRMLINQPTITPPDHTVEDSPIWTLTGGCLFLFTFGYRLLVDAYDPILWFGVCFVIGTIGLVIGYRRQVPAH